MSQDKELEIQMQFLEEATEYLNTLESVLLELKGNSRIDPNKINAALRAAHSIKGGAGMMGFRALSDLAHRLEDSFKVLKTRKTSVDIDTDLQGLLLSGVDWLRQVVGLHGAREVIDEQWLATFCYPVFEELHQRLGDPTPEDASTILAPEEGQDIIPLLFETEVEGCLQRLEAVLADEQMPCLREEVSIMAAELGGLGEMLQLEPFSQLCESVNQQLEAAPDQIEKIARLALGAWRRSQALVLTNQLDSLPTSIDLTEDLPTIRKAGYSVSIPTPVAQPEFLPTSEIEESELIWQDEVIAAQFAAFDSEVSPQEAADVPEPVDEAPQEIPSRPEVAAAFTEAEDFDAVEAFDAAVAAFAETEDFDAVEAFDAAVAAFAQAEDSELDVFPEEIEVTPVVNIPTTQPVFPREIPTNRVVEPKPEVSAGARNEAPTETTVRVSVKQLEQINDFFGELTIQRNGLNLQVERLRKLIRSLSQRVKTLDRENRELREAYDKVGTGGINLATGNHSTQVSPHQDLTAEHQLSNQADDRSLEPIQGIHSGFDALEMDRYNEMHLLSQDVMETIVQVQEVTSDIELSLEDTDQ
ncbi:MAG: Hpt domain-containing protein, partial [Nostocaceae cyanobacterium]|nr:Hpt domain-containing protein [Nostocaceae cyanobacterium]